MINVFLIALVDYRWFFRMKECQRMKGALMIKCFVCVFILHVNYPLSMVHLSLVLLPDK